MEGMIAEKLNQGLELLMLNHTKKNLQHGHQELSDHRAWTNKQLGIQPGPTGEDSEMMVLGDHITTINQPQPKPSKLGSLLKLGAGVALAATGVGAGAGIYTALPALVELLKPTPVEQVQTPEATPGAERWIGIELDKE